MISKYRMVRRNRIFPLDRSTAMLGTYGEVNTAALGGLERCVRASALEGCRKGIKLDKWKNNERIATRYDFP